LTPSAPNLFAFEEAARKRGCRRIAGVDEVGRGPLAGPVVAVAVVLPESFDLPVADSKTLTARTRERLAESMLADPGVAVGFGILAAPAIDEINILRATHAAMRLALLDLDPAPDFALVDGLRVPDLPVPAEFLVKGDSRSASIAAASIVAKVHRDRYMAEQDAMWPGYGFARNKGYGTREHTDALQRLGPCPLHRRSFAPVRNALNPGPVQLDLGFDTEP
jgi:ribonuclease HII